MSQLILSWYSDRDIFIAADIVSGTPTLQRYFTDTLPSIVILTVYKQVFWYLTFANHRTKESFALTANKPLVGTLMTIGGVMVSIAIASKNFQKSSFESVVKLPTNYVTSNYGVLHACSLCGCLTDQLLRELSIPKNWKRFQLNDILPPSKKNQFNHTVNGLK